MEHTNVSEEEAAELLGIRLSEVRRLRRIVGVAGVDFEMDGNSRRITREGLEKIAAAICPAKKETVPAIVVEVPAAGLVRELKVDSLVPNPRILMASFWDGKKTVRVRLRVRDNKNFVRGMAVPGCREINETLYSFEGRMPRTRGRF